MNTIILVSIQYHSVDIDTFNICIIHLYYAVSQPAIQASQLYCPQTGVLANWVLAA